jgi:hypothetical protein
MSSSLLRHRPRAPAWLPVHLARILSAVLDDPRARRCLLRPEQVLRLSPQESAREGSRLERAQGELLAVHRAELAFLLRQAARLRLSGDLECLEACRAGLREAQECARADGWDMPHNLRRLVPRVIGSPPQEWPDAVRLARTAFALEARESGAVLLAQALDRAGDAHAASGLLAVALLFGPPAARRVPLLRELARLQAGLGRYRRERRLLRAAAHLSESNSARAVA